MRALVVDDEAPARRKLRRLLEAQGDVVVAGEAGDGPSAVAAIRRLRPDVVFLDIRMPGLDGFEVVREVGPERMPRLVFVTAHDEYAVKAFEVRAFDYLLKPVTPSRCEALLERLRGEQRRARAAAETARLESLLAELAPRPRYLQRLLVEHEGRGILLPLRQVERLEAARNYVVVHAGGATYVLRRPLTALAGQLDPAEFVRVSRSQVVRLEAIQELQRWFHGDCKLRLRDGTELMWSRRYRAGRSDLGLG